jgi:hypothetical protein
MNPEIKFEDFEYAVMSKLLAGDDPVLECLREQYKNAHAEKREFTGHGFFTDFSFKNPVPIIENEKSFQIDDIAGIANNTNVDFVLFIDNGILMMLEGFTYGEPWPERINSFELFYGNNENRDLEKLRKECFKK